MALGIKFENHWEERWLIFIKLWEARRRESLKYCQSCSVLRAVVLNLAWMLKSLGEFYKILMPVSLWEVELVLLCLGIKNVSSFPGDSDVKLRSVTSALGSLVEEVNLFYLIYLLVYSFFIQILILITVYWCFDWHSNWANRKPLPPDTHKTTAPLKIKIFFLFLIYF